MISDKMREALSAQINAEMWSAFLYLSMSLNASDKGWKGVSHWFRKQYEEEMDHAFRIIGYMESQSAKVDLRPIGEFQSEWESVLEMYQYALEHERQVTGMIHQLCGLAEKETDRATSVFLQWFVTEQVEEEEAAKTIVDRLRLIKDDLTALFLYDLDLGER